MVKMALLLVGINVINSKCLFFLLNITQCLKYYFVFLDNLP